jgi:signal transduction histidine kinase
VAPIGGVRSRVALTALVVTLLALALAGFALLRVLHASLLDEVDTALLNRASDIADDIDINNELDAAGFPTDAESFVGIIEFPLGPNGADLPPIIEVHNDDAPDANQVMAVLSDGRRGSDVQLDVALDASVPSLTATNGNDNMRMVATDVETGDELVVVARSVNSIDRTVASTRRFLFVAVPLLAGLVGLVTWSLAGRALAPVEAMRREVEEISGSDLGRRVPEPKADDEVARLSRTMNSMLERLDADQQRQQRFSSDAAHELRSPLASMAAQLDVDLAHPDQVDWQRTAAVLRSDTARLQRMVDDLLVLARPGADPAAAGTGHGLRPAPQVDLDDLVLAEATRLRGTADGVSRITIDTSGVSAASTRGNADELRRVVDNLLANAVRHATTTVVVSLYEDDHSCHILVDDDGPGVPEAFRRTIFERFVRLDEARNRDTGGSGLGLAIVAEIIARHHGTVEASTSPQGGARFQVNLPKAQ